MPSMLQPGARRRRGDLGDLARAVEHRHGELGELRRRRHPLRRQRAPDDRRALEPRADRLGVSRAQQRLEPAETVAQLLEALGERLGVVQADAGPQVRAARGDARGVLESAGREPHELSALAGVRRREVDERRRRDVRDVAHDRDRLVV